MVTISTRKKIFIMSGFASLEKTPHLKDFPFLSYLHETNYIYLYAFPLHVGQSCIMIIIRYTFIGTLIFHNSFREIALQCIFQTKMLLFL